MGKSIFEVLSEAEHFIVLSGLVLLGILAFVAFFVHEIKRLFHSFRK